MEDAYVLTGNLCNRRSCKVQIIVENPPPTRHKYSDLFGPFEPDQTNLNISDPKAAYNNLTVQGQKEAGADKAGSNAAS